MLSPKINEKKSLIIEQILTLENELQQNIPTTLWISDLHGEGKRFISILKGRFGVLFQTCVESLPGTFEQEKVYYLTQIIRRKSFFYHEKYRLHPQDVILCLVLIIRYKLKNRDVAGILNQKFEYRSIILQLINHDASSNLIYENEVIAHCIIRELCKLVMQLILNHLVIMGDIFDRGPQPDKIIRVLNSPHLQPIISLVLGNHDLLWMGACAGNLSLIAEAMRITCRYAHLPLLERLGFDISKLKSFAEKHYPSNKITGRFKAKTDLARSLEKALAMIQFKLEEQCILQHPEYEMENRLQLEQLADRIRRKDTECLTDTHFPTLDLDNPIVLTTEEQEIIEDLKNQFVQNKKLKRLMLIFFEKGEIYNTHNDFLNIHALVPSFENGDFASFMGYSGKELLDYIQKILRQTGQLYLEGKKQDESHLSLFFYLWCGPRSPLFGKDAMKTFERYFFSDKTTHKETTLYWEKNLLKLEFREKLKKVFKINRVVYGHTPRDINKGQTMAGAEGFAINVDGGFAKAYLNRGHALIETPHSLYGIILRTPEEEKKLMEDVKIPEIQGVENIKNYFFPRKIKNTNHGKKLEQQKEIALEKLEEADNYG